MKSKRTVILSITLLLIGSFVGLGAIKKKIFTLQQRASTQQTPPARRISAALNQEEPTPIQVGVMTQRQRRHSKIFELHGERSLLDIAAERGHADIGQDVPLRIASSDEDTSKYLYNLGCKSDAVIIGNVKSKSSQLTEDGTNIFTEYEVTIEEVLKNNAGTLEPHNTVTVVRGGGAVSVNGHIIRVTYAASLPLKVQGRYLLFLSYIPETGAYKPTSYLGESSFKLENGQASQVSEEAEPFGVHNSVKATDFINNVRNALNSSCVN